MFSTAAWKDFLDMALAMNGHFCSVLVSQSKPFGLVFGGFAHESN